MDRPEDTAVTNWEGSKKTSSNHDYWGNTPPIFINHGLLILIYIYIMYIFCILCIYIYIYVYIYVYFMSIISIL